MDLTTLLLPSLVFEYFNCVHYEKQSHRIDLFLEEKPTRPVNSTYKYISKGFRDEVIIQDFPLRGNPVFLHIKRRKWLEDSTGKIISNSFDLSHLGTQISSEFAAFLKGVHRDL